MGGPPTPTEVPMNPDATPAPSTTPGVGLTRSPTALSPVASKSAATNKTASPAGSAR